MNNRGARRRVFVLFTAGLITTLVASACGTTEFQRARPTTTLSPTGGGSTAVPDVLGTGPPTPALTGSDARSKVPMTGYTPEFRKWECPYGRKAKGGVKIDCYQLKVPESRTDKDSPRITLAIAVLHSTAEHPAADPVIFLQGGPGGSALADVEIWTDPPSPWLAERDLILLDQRGTGYSIPRLQCEGSYDYTSELDTAILGQCTTRLRQGKVNLGAYNTDESAADVEDVRKALKLEKWNLYGASYGTRLALVTMDQHPDGLRSVVIDSVYPPGVPALEDMAVIFGGAVDKLLADCRADISCNNAYPNLRSRFLQTVDFLNAQPAEVQVNQGGVPTRGYVRGNTLVHLLFSALYNAPGIPDLPRALDAAARGDVSTAVTIMIRSLKEARDAASGITTTTKPGGAAEPPGASDSRPYETEAIFYTIECAEEAHMNTLPGIDARAASVPAQLAAPVVKNAKAELASCNDWQVSQRDLAETHSDIPTLVLGGPYDPITPARWGQQAAANLPNSRFVLIPNSGHATVLAGDCPVELMHRFLNDPASGGGEDCGTAPPQFRLR